MTNIPFKVYPPALTVIEEWADQAPKWQQIARGVILEDAFDPLSIKALYVTGLMFHLCFAVNVLLAADNPTAITFYPSYAIFASTVELLGRCITGNSTSGNTTVDITTGFYWLANPSINPCSAIQDDHILVKTRNFSYPISLLVALRHFTAHGQAVIKDKIKGVPDDFKFDFDPLLLGEFPPILASAIEAYLSQLTSNESLSTNLAKASIAPLHSEPIFETVWRLMSVRESFPTIVGEEIRKMDWSYKSPLIRLGKTLGAA